MTTRTDDTGQGLLLFVLTTVVLSVIGLAFMVG